MLRSQINEFPDVMFVVLFKGDFQIYTTASVNCICGHNPEQEIFSLYFIVPFISESVILNNSQLGFILESISTYSMIQIFLQCS